MYCYENYQKFKMLKVEFILKYNVVEVLYTVLIQPNKKVSSKKLLNIGTFAQFPKNSNSTHLKMPNLKMFLFFFEFRTY